MDIKALKKYLTDHTAFIVGLCLLAVSVVMFVGIGMAQEVPFMIFLSIFMALISVFLILNHVRDRIKLGKWLNEMEMTGELPRILQDFRDGRKYFKDQLRMGVMYIFTKDMGEVFQYKDIERVFLHIHMTNGSEDSRSLKIVTKNGKVYVVCTVTSPKRAGDLDHIVHIIKIANPEVKIGL